MTRAVLPGRARKAPEGAPVDTAAREVVRTVPVGRRPFGVDVSAAVRPSDGRLLLPFEGERPVVPDPRTGRTAVERMTADTHRRGAAVTPGGTLPVAGTGSVDPAVGRGPSPAVRTPDGRERVHPPDGPHEDVAVSRDGRGAHVTGGFTRDGFWDGSRSSTWRRAAHGGCPRGGGRSVSRCSDPRRHGPAPVQGTRRCSLATETAPARVSTPSLS
ncbi:hypothetical protein [Streptomyces sp. NPDC093094]|uniref:hypothetical protein n=1 Tax=Streptomyces sp. NPDC093094 TaxID=3366026 RepID=UPI00382F2E73